MVDELGGCLRGIDAGNIIIRSEAEKHLGSGTLEEDS